MSAVDRLLLGFLAALGVLTAVFVPSPAALLASLVGMAGCIVVLGRLEGRSRISRIAHGFVPVPILGALVNAVGPAIQSVNPARADATLSALDAKLFGPLAIAWTSAAGRPGWLTDAASVAYASYYLLPIGAAAVLWSRKRGDFDRFVFSLSVVLLSSYAAYFIAPAHGPRIPDAFAQNVLGGGVLSAALRSFLRACERNELDAFPSGHAAVSLVFLAEAWTLFPRWRAAFAAAVAGIVFSTVYLSLHYVVDVLAGAALAAIVLAALPWLRARFGLGGSARPEVRRTAAPRPGASPPAEPARQGAASGRELLLPSSGTSRDRRRAGTRGG